jgi:hypothetical protein
MATGLPWPGELDVLRKGVSRLIGEDVREYEDIDDEHDTQVGVQAAAA